MKRLIFRIIMKLPKPIKFYFLKKIFKMSHGYKVNVKNPQTFSEKLFVKIKYDKKNIGYDNMIDKIKVKDYCKDFGLKSPKTIWVGSKITKDILANLELPIVLKTTVGSGDVKIIKTEENRYKWIKYFNKQVKISHYKRTGEIPYKGIENRIFVEEYLDNGGTSPDDIKIHCFNNSEKVIASVFFDRFTDKNATLYDEEMNILDMTFAWKNNSRNFPYPDNFKEIINIAKKVGKDFSYARVDMYMHNNELYIGEMTFTQGSATDKITPYSKDLQIGKEWNYKGLEKYQKKS